MLKNIFTMTNLTELPRELKTFKRKLKRPERFWSKVKKTDTCWLWIGCKNGNGYGAITIDSVTLIAHRVSYEIHIGEIGYGDVIMHDCDNPVCVNPSHLRAGTQKENVNDCINKGRTNYVKGEAVRHAKLTEYQVNSIKKEHEKGLKQYELAENYNVNQSTISRIIHKKRWKHTQSQ